MGGVQNSCHLWREGFRIPAQGGTVFPRKAGGTQSSCAKREGRRFLAIMIWRILPLRMQENAPFYTYISKFSRGSNPRPLVLGWWGAQCEIFSYSGSKYNYDACWLDMWIIRKGNIIPWTYSLYNRQYWMSFKSVKISGGVLLIISDMNFIPHTSKPHTNHKYFKRRLIFISNIWSINTQNARNCIFCLLVNEIFGGLLQYPLMGRQVPRRDAPKVSCHLRC